MTLVLYEYVLRIEKRESEEKTSILEEFE